MENVQLLPQFLTFSLPYILTSSHPHMLKSSTVAVLCLVASVSVRLGPDGASGSVHGGLAGRVHPAIGEQRLSADPRDDGASGWTLFRDDPAPFVDTFTLRKIRPTFTGRVAKYFDFKVMPDLGGGQVGDAGRISRGPVFAEVPGPDGEGQGTGRLRAADRRPCAVPRTIARDWPRPESRQRHASPWRCARDAADVCSRRVQRQTRRRV